MAKEILWIRKLECGHERQTNIAFMVGNFTSPEIGEDCFCRECNQEVKIVGVCESETIKPIKELKKHLDKRRNSSEGSK